jgi:hypothetical protein
MTSNTPLEMIMPEFIESVLLQPEQISILIESLRKTHPVYTPVADLAKMTLSSSSTNDYLEKIAVESIGFRHIDDKLGADGVNPTNETDKLEAKPSKGTFKAVINDDTPMKLLKSFKEIPRIVFLNSNNSGSKVNFAILAPFSAWDNSRYKNICEHLKLSTDDKWTHSCESLPTDLNEKEAVLRELLTKHVKKQYVRSSPLNLDVLSTIPKSQIRLWKHPEFPKNKLPRTLQNFF